MNSIRRFPKEQAFTSGEKALVAMIFAGICGLWAGSNLLTPSSAAGLTAAATAMLPATPGPTEAQRDPPPTTRDHPWLVSQVPEGLTARDDPPIPTF